MEESKLIQQQHATAPPSEHPGKSATPRTVVGASLYHHHPHQ